MLLCRFFLVSFSLFFFYFLSPLAQKHFIRSAARRGEVEVKTLCFSQSKRVQTSVEMIHEQLLCISRVLGVGTKMFQRWNGTRSLFLNVCFNDMYRKDNTHHVLDCIFPCFLESEGDKCSKKANVRRSGANPWRNTERLHGGLKVAGHLEMFTNCHVSRRRVWLQTTRIYLQEGFAPVERIMW
jgi:hypothetical protein